MTSVGKLSVPLLSKISIRAYPAGQYRYKGLMRKPIRVITPERNPVPNSLGVGVPLYTKLGKQDEEFTNVMASLKTKRRRDKANKILLEGRRLIADAIQAGVELDCVYFTLPETIEGLPLDNLKEGQLKKVLYKKMSLWSDLTTCPGVMGVFKKPSIEQLTQSNSSKIPLTVICDNIRDPGNMGALVRTTAAVGCKQMLLTKGCVDLWDPKVLRAGCGAHFRVPIFNDVPWVTMPSYIGSETAVYLADNHGETIPSQTFGTHTKGHFDDKDALDQEEAADEDQRYILLTENGEKLSIDNSYSDPKELKTCRRVVLPCQDYTAIQYSTGHHCALVIGGEVHGLSDQAHKLAVDHSGVRVHVPSANGVESLNTAIAASVILFEMRRQILLSAGYDLE